MTFEEFFGKKKISLATLAEHEPALFAEFRSHYGLMGPKSFDHTKKYWFNELRRRFPAPKEEKTIPAIVNKEAVINTGAAVTPIVQTAKQGFKPMFKRSSIAKTAEEEKLEMTSPAEENITADLPAKPAYVPKFKPAVKVATTPDLKSIEEQQETVQLNTPDIPAETQHPEIKPAYKPRFNASINTKKESSAQPEEEKNNGALASQPEPEETSVPDQNLHVAKQVYKPRFNAAITAKKENPAQPEEENNNDLASQPEPEETPTPEEDSQAETPAAKPAYKPRFRPKAT